MQYIKIECSCGREADLSADKFDLSPGEFKVDKLADSLSKLQCSKCYNQPNFVFNDKDQLLFDMTNLSHCSSCEIPVSIARLNAVPGTSVCALCAQEGVKDARTPPPHPQPPSELSKCPTCEKYGRNSPTVMRQNGVDKSWFVGCALYPNCRWTKNL